MTDFVLIVGGIAAALLLVALLAYLALRRGRIAPLRGARLARVQRRFHAERAMLQEAFFRHAAASGKPRGLRWKRCEFEEQVTFARDRRGGTLLALVGVTISFEAIVGGPMEDVEAVGNLRAASALFVYTPRGWQPSDRTLFNLEPKDALARPEWELEEV